MRYETERIILEPFEEKYIKPEWFIDPIITAYNSWGLGAYTKKQINEFLNSIEEGNKIVWAIRVKRAICMSSDGHIGNISLQSMNNIYRSAEFAIVIGKTDYWKGGYGTEAGKLVLSHGFDKLNMNRIWTGTAITNIGMRKLAEKMGMTLEGHFREGMFLSGEYEDICCYSILKKEWDKINGKK